MENLNLIFNKMYYSVRQVDPISEMNKPESYTDELKKNMKVYNDIIVKSEFKESDKLFTDIPESLINTRIAMKTTYPGLLVGTGYFHGIGGMNTEDDINVGFSFDYVSGQPYIPGSSVKGIIHQAFRTSEFIEDYFRTIRDKEKIKKIETFIFGDDENKIQGNDIFFDAVVVQGAGIDGGNLMGYEYITPHLNPTKNPIPIHMLKIMPSVIIEFRFKLHDIKDDNGCMILSKYDKKRLFDEALSILGVGAKTNVGFGGLISQVTYSLEAAEIYTGTALSPGNNKVRIKVEKFDITGDLCREDTTLTKAEFKQVFQKGTVHSVRVKSKSIGEEGKANYVFELEK